MVITKLLSLYWQQGIAYRASVILWRSRQLLTTITALFIWNAIFANTTTVGAYDSQSMVTYILLTSFLQSVILATALNNLPGRVYSGEISTILLKPLNIFTDFWLQDMADKAKNLFFVLIETGIILALLKPVVIWPDWQTAVLWTVLVFLGVWINFCLTLLFGAIGFWSPDAWGPRFLFYMIVEFTAGKFYPIDILPGWVQTALYFTPFPYFSYWQTQLWLDRLSSTQVAAISFGAFFWSVVLWYTVKLVWNKGLRSYAATGR